MILFWLLLLLLALYILRTILGPTIWDRLLGLNLIATKVIILIIVVAYIYEISYLLDFAIIYALTGFIGTIFLSIFFLKTRVGRRRANPGETGGTKHQTTRPANEDNEKGVEDGR
jgi:multicomponent Na+:H+ antiporter subunit F